jgi:hypothetical protein
MYMLCRIQYPKATEGALMVPAWFPAGTAGRGVGRGRAVPAVILAAALAAAATACSSSSSSGTATATSTAGSATASASATGSASSSSASPAASKLTGTAATALVTKAVDNTKAAPSVVVKGAGVSTGTAGQSVSFNLTLVQKAGCQGTISQSATETFQLVETGGYVWLKPSAAYYASLKLSAAAQALVADKWIKVKSTDAQIGDLPKICSFSGLFGSLKTPTGASFVATPTTYQGQSAYVVTQSGQQGYAYVTNPGKPMLAKLAEPGSSGGVITFTEYSTPLTITAPTAAESIDGSKLGI